MKTELFADIPDELCNELTTIVFESPTTRVERIVSPPGYASPDGFWYDQDEHEWVAVLSGSARLRFDEGVVELEAGDALDIVPHRRHRVEQTDAEQVTVWLAVFSKPTSPAYGSEIP
ncbi:MAG: cupin domain-containing protein [Planctomycetota bacterium]